MSRAVHAYTSITSNYLPKARVLAESVKRVDPDVQFHLILSDVPPVGFNLADEPFDNLITIEELVTDDFPAWVFKHSVVELCTAVKGAAMVHLFERAGAEQVFYFDPDIVVFGRLQELQSELAQANLVLTPHLTDPETTERGILDNEMSSLRHGVFNLGFIGVRNTPEGLRFAQWWALRLSRYCHDNLPLGIFTDQKWVDLAPCFFDGVRVLRSPGFNVATWNISNRLATGSLDEGILINAEPLGFYHFSGFDSGDQATMLAVYGKQSPLLTELREWYIRACEGHGQSAIGSLPCRYDFFSDGERISRDHRLLYREREDLQDSYPNPYEASGPHCYKAWYAAHPHEHPPGDVVRIARGVPLAVLFEELARHFNLMLVEGRGSNRIKRGILRVWVKTLQLLAGLARRGAASA
ncbi:MAG: glycosyl transferase [Halioglobus sp.]|nr:glycosyl transferase [Halioglobus sp.]